MSASCSLFSFYMSMLTCIVLIRVQEADAELRAIQKTIRGTLSGGGCPLHSPPWIPSPSRDHTYLTVHACVCFNWKCVVLRDRNCCCWARRHCQDHGWHLEHQSMSKSRLSSLVHSLLIVHMANYINHTSHQWLHIRFSVSHFLLIHFLSMPHWQPGRRSDLPSIEAKVCLPAISYVCLPLVCQLPSSASLSQSSSLLPTRSCTKYFKTILCLRHYFCCIIPCQMIRTHHALLIASLLPPGWGALPGPGPPVGYYVTH